MVNYKIPKDKILYTRYSYENGEIHHILCKNKYFTGDKNWILYSIDENNLLVEIGKGNNPLELERKYDIFHANG